MISEKDKQAILNGAYGVSRSGLKCKFVGLVDASDPYSHFFVYFNKKGIAIHETTTENLKENIHFDSDLDVIGLWEDEPFDLDRALNGEPVKLRDGKKAYIFCDVPSIPEFNHNPRYSLLGLIEKTSSYSAWTRDGKISVLGGQLPGDIIGMWKEPEPVSNTVTLTLPCPLKEPQDEMWILTVDGYIRSSYGKNIQLDIFESRPYFGSEEDAKAWFDTMQNSRK